MTDLEKCRQLLQEWVDKQGHDRCWYYPEIFNKFCEILGVVPTVSPDLPTEAEFEEFCGRYRREEYSKLPK